MNAIHPHATHVSFIPMLPMAHSLISYYCIFDFLPSEFLEANAAELVALAVETLRLYNEPRADQVVGRCTMHASQADGAHGRHKT